MNRRNECETLQCFVGTQEELIGTHIWVARHHKWNKRVNLSSDEIPAALKTLLVWYLHYAQEQQRQQAQTSEDDGLGDLDDRPF